MAKAARTTSAVAKKGAQKKSPKLDKKDEKADRKTGAQGAQEGRGQTGKPGKRETHAKRKQGNGDGQVKISTEWSRHQVQLRGAPHGIVCVLLCLCMLFFDRIVVAAAMTLTSFTVFACLS